MGFSLAITPELHNSCANLRSFPESHDLKMLNNYGNMDMAR